ncbi:MAG: asparagine synthase-related protein [bacterium]|nr:asparagine synthase-related protein [bacterium]
MFAAIFNIDSRPVDPRQILISNHDIEILGCDRRVAFIYSKAAPSPAPGQSSGIQDLEGRYWIVGRVRLDARSELQSVLSERIRGPLRDISDAQLCLHAYAAWGDAFVDRIAGDFCFVLWDDDRNRLVCVRDQLGIRSLFHAEAGGSRFVSDSLDWIASRSSVNRDLDDAWVADFLTVGHSLEFERTVYRHIQRLAPAHVLTISDSGATVRRYWRLNIQEPLYFRDRRLYVERFLDLLSNSIVDRLPAGRVGISMSGGLDSTTLAACAVHATGDAARVVAECLHFEKLESDNEKHFSSLVAQRLGIELRIRACDELTYDSQWQSRSIKTPEPSTLIVSAHMDRAVALERANKAQVWFYGEGPDNALAFERGAYLSWLVGRRDWLRLGEAGLLYLRAKGLAGLTETLRRYAARRQTVDEAIDVPPWLDRSLVDRLGQEERLSGMSQLGGVGASSTPRHPWHPGAIAWFNDPIWPAVFANYEFEESLAPFVLRHPFLDLRVLEFMLSVPTVPWARNKLLLREAMRGRLPDELLARKKATLPSAALTSPLRIHGLPPLLRNSCLDRYIDVRAVPVVGSSGRHWQQVVAVHALDYWLTQGTP